MILQMFVWASASLAVLPTSPTEVLCQTENVSCVEDSIVGSWVGTLSLPGADVRIVFHLRLENGALSASLDSPDQGAAGIPVDEVTFSVGHLRLKSTAVSGEFEGDLSYDRGCIEGEWRQGGMNFPVTMRRITEGQSVGPNRPQEPVPPLPYQEEEVRYPNAAAGIELEGTLTLPRVGAPHPAVLLISGSGPQDRNETVAGHRPFLVLADHLTRSGIAVLRFDDRGVRGSSGDFRSATSEDFATDVAAGVDYLNARSDIRSDAIGLLGHSEGGLIAPMVAAARDDIAFVVLMAAPGVSGGEVTLEQNALLSHVAGRSAAAIERDREVVQQVFRVLRQEPDTALATVRLTEVLREGISDLSEAEREASGITAETIDQAIQGQLQQFNTPWFRFYLTFDPASALSRVKVPLLAINGELDLQVSSAQNLPAIRRALESGGNQDFTIVELPGLNHLFQECSTGSPSEYSSTAQTISPVALNLIAGWILERVRITQDQDVAPPDYVGEATP